MKKIIYSLMTLVLAFSTLSCEGLLDAENKTAGGQTAENYFSTAEGLLAFRANAYYSLKKIVTANDIFEDGTDLYVPSRGKTPTAFQQYTLTPETGDVKNMYAYCYQVINNANGLLSYGGDQYKADALFLRALGYYFLTQHFGPVPYSDKYINDANREYPRKDLQFIYDHLIADLDPLANDANIPEWTIDGTVNRRAINALLGRICLAAGWDLETTLADAARGTWTKTASEYFGKAAAYADAAIAGIDFSAQSFEQKWYPANENTNKETFFAVQYERSGYPGESASGGHGMQNDYGSYYGVVSENGLKGVGSVKVPSVKALSLFEKGDERYEATYMTTFYNYDGTWGTTGYYAYYNNVEGRSTLPIALYYAPYYVTKAEFEAFLSTNKSRFVKGDNKNTPFAFLMQNPVIKYYFKEDGSIQKTESLPYNAGSLAAQLNFTPTVKKWDDPGTIQEDGNTKNCYRDIVMLHASASCLDAAEAYYMLGNDVEAFKRINALRSRANASTLTNVSDYAPAYSTTSTFGEIGMIDLILDERARELYAESTRWIDLRRTRQLVRYNIEFNYLIDNVSNMSNTTGEIKWYRPIPTEELSSNTAMGNEDQNPGY